MEVEAAAEKVVGLGLTEVRGLGWEVGVRSVGEAIGLVREG